MTYAEHVTDNIILVHITLFGLWDNKFNVYVSYDIYSLRTMSIFRSVAMLPVE